MCVMPRLEPDGGLVGRRLGPYAVTGDKDLRVLMGKVERAERMLADAEKGGQAITGAVTLASAMPLKALLRPATVI